jgi:hypothetical protein
MQPEPASKPLRLLGRVLERGVSAPHEPSNSPSKEGKDSARRFSELHDRGMNRLNRLRSMSAGSPLRLEYDALRHLMKRHFDNMVLLTAEYAFDDGCGTIAHGDALVFSPSLNILYVVEVKVLRGYRDDDQISKATEQASVRAARLSSWLPHLAMFGSFPALGAISVNRMLVTCTTQNGLVFPHGVRHVVLPQKTYGFPNLSLVHNSTEVRVRKPTVFRTFP